MSANIKSVLFVCTANSGRSPMAHYYFKHLVDKERLKIRVDSAATDFYQVDIADYTLELLSSDKIDGSGHKPKVINRTLLSSFDLVLVMDRGHLEKIRSKFPEYSDKVFLLAKYCAGIEKEVEDPLGSSLDDYKETYEEVKGYLHQLLEKLRNK